MQKLYTQVLCPFLLLCLLFLLPGTGRGQVLAWNTSGISTAVTTFDATTQNSNLDIATLSRGAGVTATSLSGGFSASGWVDSTRALAVANNRYFQFKVKAHGGSLVSLSDITAWFRRSGTGPIRFQWQYSRDNFVTAVNIGDSLSYSLSTSNGDVQPIVDVSGIAAMQSVAGTDSITIRLYGWHASGAAGTFALGKPGSSIASLSVGGTVTSTGAAITVSSNSLAGFSTTAGTASTAQSLTTSGTGLSDDIMITPNGFEVSTDGGANYSVTPVTLTQTGGVVGNTTVNVRIPASAPAGVITGSLSLSSGSATQMVTLSGSVSSGVPANVRINQVYGGGGNSGATFKNDFIELYNNESFPVNLNGWSVQYLSAAGTGSWGVTALHGIIPAQSFFLIQESAGAGGTTNLPTPDVLTGSSPLPVALNMSATAGKVILSDYLRAQVGGNPSSPDSVMDKVGYGGASGFEIASADTPSNTTALRRVTDGLDNNNNKTDFVLDAPNPRNSTYKTSAPVITSFNPPNGSDSIPYNYALSFSFNKKVVKGSGSITIFADGVAGTPIDISSTDVVLSNNSFVSVNAVLSGGKHYVIQISGGAFQDIYGNAFAGITDNTTWAFQTFDGSVATALPAHFNFSSCTGSGLLPDGFTQFNVTGNEIWDCTTFGRNPIDPSEDTAFEHAVQINGYSNGADHLNQDWLISPKFDLTGTTYPLLNFWSRNAFSGDPLQLKISTDYSGTGDPALATWTDLNGKFPSTGSDIWTLSSNINLSAYKQGNVYLAWVYRSTTDDGSRWTLDDIGVIDSPTPPPASVTLSANNFQLGYAAVASTVTKKLIVTGNDLVTDITLTVGGGFLISTDSVNFSDSVALGHDTANNVPEPIFIRFAPSVNNAQYFDSVIVKTSDTTAIANVKGNSIDPASTLSVVDWNLNWFGTPEAGFGPPDKALQEQNVGIILPSLHADIYALEEVVNEPALAAIVATMPGYAYVINNYGSHSNTQEPNHYDLSTIQKLAFVYNTAKIQALSTDSLFSIGVNTAADTATEFYNDFASGRFPYMLTANVTLSDNNGGTILKQIRFINIHAKANTGDVKDAYNRRKLGAHALDSLVRHDYPTENVIILGDYNDDLNQTITAGINPPVTSYSAFTIDNASSYIFPTKLLSQQGQHSDVSYSSVIDNVIINTPLSAWYLPSSATVLSDVSDLVAKYGTTTTDHYPVFTQMSFAPPTPLPVKLLSFTGIKQADQVKLTWTTAQESNSKEFDVERSDDGNHFTAIGVVAAAGNSQGPITYQFVDQQPMTGANYYRLRQVDLDAHAEYSKTVKLDFSKQLSLRISPNPAHETLYISVDGPPDIVSIAIVDLSGRIVKQIVSPASLQSQPVDIAGLARGIYTVKVVSQQSVTTQKLLIQ